MKIWPYWNPLTRIIFKSTMQSKNNNSIDINKIVVLSTTRNQTNGIVGSMIWCQATGEIMQIMEGPTSTLKHLYKQIENDPRHDNIILLSCVKIDKKTFSKWHVRLVRDYQKSNIRSDFEIISRICKTSICDTTFANYMGETYLMKIYSKTKDNLRFAENEKKHLRHISPNNFIIKLIDTFQDPCNVYFIYDNTIMLSFRQLQPKITDESHVKYYLNQILQAVNHIHNHKIIHGGMTIDSVFLDKLGHVKVSNFELAGKNYIHGDPRYFTPELILENRYDMSNDIWGVGLIFYQLLGYKLIWDQYTDINMIFDKIIKTKITIKDNRSANKILQNMVSHYLVLRKSAEMLLKDDYFEEVIQSPPYIPHKRIIKTFDV